MTSIDIPEWANRINAAYVAEQTEYIKLCKLCAEAENLTRDEKEALYKLLAFSKSRFSKYARIGNNDDLLRSDKILTGCYSIDYEIAQLTPDEILKGFARRVLHSDCSREQVPEFKTSIRPKSRPPRKQRVYATVTVPASASKEVLDEVARILEPARRIDGVKIVKPENKSEKAKDDYTGELQRRFRHDATMLCRILARGKMPADRLKAIDQTLDNGSNTEIAQILISVGYARDRRGAVPARALGSPSFVGFSSLAHATLYAATSTANAATNGARECAGCQVIQVFRSSSVCRFWTMGGTVTTRYLRAVAISLGTRIRNRNFDPRIISLRSDDTVSCPPGKKRATACFKL